MVVQGVSVMQSNKEQRFLDFQRILNDIKSLNLPIVVEGKRDTIALRKLEIISSIRISTFKRPVNA